MDEIDICILKLLKENSRQSISYISKHINLSRPCVKERITRMEENGIIEKYTIKINDKNTNKQIIIYSLVSEPKMTVDSFIKYLSEIPEVKSVDIITGRANYLVRTAVNLSSAEDLTELLKKIKRISKIENFISLEHYEF